MGSVLSLNCRVVRLLLLFGDGLRRDSVGQQLAPPLSLVEDSLVLTSMLRNDFHSFRPKILLFFNVKFVKVVGGGE